MILATNRPNSPVAKSFAQLRVPNSFEFMQSVSKALGREIRLDRPGKAFFVNGIVGYGRRGYIEVEKTDEVDKFRTSIIMPNDQRSKPKIETMYSLRALLSYLEKYTQAKMAAHLN